MSGRQIIKRALASPGCIVMVGRRVFPPMIARTSYGRGQVVAGDGYLDSDLSTRAIAAVVFQMTRMLRHCG
ncbi:hypothetical protein AVEN_218600-1, partial [Araneus ventricosus]